MPLSYNYDQVTVKAAEMVRDMIPDGEFDSQVLWHDPDPVLGLPARNWSTEELKPIVDATSMSCIYDDTPTFYLFVKSNDPDDNELGWGMIWIDYPELRLHRNDNHPCIIVKWPNGQNRLLVTATHGKITKWEEFDDGGFVEVSEVYFPYADDRVVGIRCR